VTHHWSAGDEGAEQTQEEELDAIIYTPPDKVQAAPPDSRGAAWQLSPPQAPDSDGTAWAREQEEYELAPNQQDLKYDWTELVYTDGSQQTLPLGPFETDIVVLGSGLYIPESLEREEQRVGIRSNSRGKHNTAYRAELIAILGALRLGHHKIMTDSVNSIHAIRAAIYYPMRVRFHRHKNILEEIKTAIQALDGEVMLIKVRGHAGIPGNEHADDIASSVATTGRADMDLSMVDSNTRPLSIWPYQKVWKEDPLGMTGLKQTWEQVENLDDALTRRIQDTDLRMGTADTSTIYYASMQKAMEDISETHADTWLTLGGITEAMKCTRAKYLTGQLPTGKNLKRYRKRKSDICLCCKKHKDGGHHAVAWCPGIQACVQEKHNAAVRIITKAIANGDLGADGIVYNDGGSASKWLKAGAPQLHRSVSDIPRDLLPREDFQSCRSRPDIILYRRRALRRSENGQWRAKPAQITLVEVKYVRDTDPSRTMRDPFTQHNKMYDKIRERHPAADVRRLVVLLGVAGSIYTQYLILSYI